MLLLVTIHFFYLMSQVVTRSDVIAKLQKEILDLQGLRVPLESAQRETGLDVINNAFPNKTFPVGAVHEFISQSKGEAAAASGFIAGLLGKLTCNGACLWVSGKQSIFPPALKAFGISPDRIIFVQAPNSKEALWIIEEGLKCEPLAAVVGEVQNLSFTESRRLQLAVEKSHVTGFIHRGVQGVAGNVACVSRWQVRPLPSMTMEALPGVGLPHWEVRLSKIRNGKPGTWHVQWTPDGFQVVVERTPAIPLTIRKAV